jgi:hypothetical protein
MEHLPKRHWANGPTPLVSYRPTVVVGIAQSVKDSEERWYLTAFVGSKFDTNEFVSSAEVGCFNGLLVEHNARRYAVVDGRMEAV